MIPLDPALIAPRAAPAAAPADARAVIEAQMAMLTRLAQIGMALAEDCGRQAQAVAAGSPPPDAADAGAPTDARPDPGLSFARVARAVRMTIALQSRLLKELAELDRADERAERSRETDRRMRLSRLAEQAAEAAVAAKRDAGQRYADEDAVEDEIERLSSEAYERLTDAEDGDLWGRPFDQVVAGICADLGLSPDWTARLAAAVQAPPDPGGEASREAEPPPPGAALYPPPLAGEGGAHAQHGRERGRAALSG